MKLLLTGEPHSGKSTLLAKLIDSIEHKQGFVTAEIAENGQRRGFELVSSDGRKVLFADVDSTGDIRVSRYGMNIEALDEFIDELPVIEQGAILYLDEIGQMQMYSEKFKQLARQYVDSGNHLIGTISKVYDDDFIKSIREDNNVEIIEVTLENRDELTTTLLARIDHINEIEKPMNIAEKLKEINLPDGSFVIVGSGILGALGIRESRDIDMIVSEEVYAQLDAEGWEHDVWGDQQTVLKKDLFDLGRYWGKETVADLLKEAQYVDGLPYLSLDNVYKWKKDLGREKDLRDLKLIEAYKQK